MKKTPLHQWHVAHGANMAAFGSYSMPLWYPQGAKSEHVGVIESCGLFDTSHMAIVMVKGEGAPLLLQKTFSKDLDRCLGKAKTPLVPGRCVYGVFHDDRAHVIDDAIVYLLSKTCYMIVVNAGMGGVVSRHLASFTASSTCEVSDMSGKIGEIDIQGPAAARILAHLLQNSSEVFSKMLYFSFKGRIEPLPNSTEVLLQDNTSVQPIWPLDG